MKNIEKFKNLIRFIVSIFASREFGFVYCIIGTLAQCAHTYYLIDSVSSLSGFWRIFQALALSIFISSSLLFFTAIAEDKNEYGEYNSPADKKIHLTVTLFMWIEIIINLYYYAAHLLLTDGIYISDNAKWFNFIFAIIISCMIPVTIKLYAGIIQAKEWFEALTKEYENEPLNNKYVTKEYLNNFKSDILNEVKIESNNIFEKGTEKFLKDFEKEVSNVKNVLSTKEQPKEQQSKEQNIEKETNESSLNFTNL